MHSAYRANENRREPYNMEVNYIEISNKRECALAKHCSTAIDVRWPLDHHYKSFLCYNLSVAEKTVCANSLITYLFDDLLVENSLLWHYRKPFRMRIKILISDGSTLH